MRHAHQNANRSVFSWCARRTLLRQKHLTYWHWGQVEEAHLAFIVWSRVYQEIDLAKSDPAAGLILLYPVACKWLRRVKQQGFRISKIGYPRQVFWYQCGALSEALLSSQRIDA